MPNPYNSNVFCLERSGKRFAPFLLVRLSGFAGVLQGLIATAEEAAL